MRYFTIVLLAAALTACASASKPGAMVAELTEATIIDESSVLRENIAVGDVSGGKETNPLWTSEVSSEDFAEALRLSFTSHAMLAMGESQYRLDAELVKLKQPFAGFNMTVTSIVAYTLTDVATGKVVYKDTVEEAYTAKVGDAFMGVQRLRLANEGSIKGNISTLIKSLIEKIDANEATQSIESDAEDEADADASS